MGKKLWIFVFCLITILFLNSCVIPPPAKSTNDLYQQQMFLRWFIFPTNIPRSDIIDGIQLRLTLVNNGINPIFLSVPDDYYSIVDESWFKTNIFNNYKPFLFNKGLNKRYVVDKNDCDDFSKTFSFYCRTKMVDYPQYSYNIPVADMYYIVNKNGRHAINLVVVCDEKKKLKLLFIEPQDPKFVSFTNQLSIYLLNF